MTTALSKLCDIKDWDSSAFASRASDILTREPAGECPKHRKLWEFTKTVEALEHYQLLHREAVGLSVAAGSERILYYLTHYVKQVVATDIYGVGSFSDREAEPSFLEHPENFAPYAYDEERLSPLYMNALDLEFEDNTFDFAFSLSSIEHFGGFKKSLRAIQEMGRVVRPGGVVIVTTDCSLNGLQTNEVFLKGEMEQIAQQSGLILDQPIDWSLSEETKSYMLDMRKDDLGTIPHLNLKLFGARFTSICLVLRKPGEAVEYARPSRTLDEQLEACRITSPSFVGKRSPSLLSLALEFVRGKLRGVRYRLEEWIFTGRGSAIR